MPDAVAASSPAYSDPATVLAGLSPSDRQSWLLTGNVPESKTAPESKNEPSPAESAPAEPEIQAVSTETPPAPASEPGRESPKKGADLRKQQLHDEIQDLLARRAQLRAALEDEERHVSTRRTPQPEPSQTPTRTSHGQPSADAFPEFPSWLEANPQGNYERYIAEMSRHEALATYQRLQTETQTQRQQQELQRAASERIAAHNARWQKALDANPELASVRLLAPPIDLLPPGTAPTVENIIAQQIVESEHSPQIIEHLHAHPDELQALSKLTSFAHIARTIGKLEAKFDTPPSAPRSLTGAPHPPSTPIGQKATAPPANEADAAGVQGDFRAYLRAMNRDEIRARTGK